jgi:hypothetical protein
MELLPPLDLTRYFAAHSAGVVAVTVAGNPLVSARPGRAILWIANSSPTTVLIWPGGLPPAGGGISVGPGSDVLITQRTHGPLAQVGWGCSAAVPASVAVIELAVTHPPQS